MSAVWTGLLSGVGLLGSGIQAGALLMVLLGVCPSLRSATVLDWMRWHVSLDRSIERYMPPLNVVTSLATLVLLFLPQPLDVRLLRVAGLVGNIGLALMSELANVRMNKRIAARLAAVGPVLEPAAGPAIGPVPELDPDEAEQLAAVRTRWIDWHRLRTVVIVKSFACYVAAAVLLAA